MLNTTASSIEKPILATVINKTTRMVGSSIHLLSMGLLSAITSSTPQENAITDASPMGYTVSATPILAGIQNRAAMAKSATAAVQ